MSKRVKILLGCLATLVLIWIVALVAFDLGEGYDLKPTRLISQKHPPRLPQTAFVSVTLEEVLTGLDKPVELVWAAEQAYVVEQDGLIKVMDRLGGSAPRVFVDLRERVSKGGERGLLGLAFHPKFPHNRRLFVYYTDALDGANTVAELQAGPDGPTSTAATTSLQVLLAIPDFAGNHNGGQLAFGPDGALYVGTGDGGGGGDPQKTGQDRTRLLGKILRLDIDQQEPGQGYTIPPDNPWANHPEGKTRGWRPEIWAWGLRNPWRFSFDRQTGDLFIGDVGQNRHEEIDLIPSGQGGLNFGWNLTEGPDCFPRNRSVCDRQGQREPIASYPHAEGCSVTGGYVYRGEAIPALTGAYVFGDYCSGTLWALTPEPSGGWQRRTLLLTSFQISAFAQDPEGELYVLDHKGSVHRLVPLPPSSDAPPP